MNEKEIERYLEKRARRRRLFAWVGIVLLAMLYLLTLIFALIDSAWTYNMFKMCLGGTIVIPVLIYACMMLDRTLNKRGDAGTDNNHTTEESKK